MNTLYIILGILALVVFYVIGIFNSLIQLKNRVHEAESDIGVQQKRRHNIIPNLVETVKGYATHEKETLERVIQARNSAMQANESGNLKEMQAAENMLSSTLKSIFALSESYPDLKANQNFMHLQEELVDAEDKIQAARRFYNSNVQVLNTKIEQFPSNIIAGQFGITRKDFYEVEAAATEVPNVKF